MVSEFHKPRVFKNGYKANLNKAVRYIQDDGMKVPEAVSLAFGVNETAWYRWKDEALEDWENGYTATPLQKVVTALTRADMESGRKLTRKARQIALDKEEPSVDMLKFLLERRHGYKKETRQDVEVSAKDDFNFNINIVDSQKKED